MGQSYLMTIIGFTGSRTGMSDWQALLLEKFLHAGDEFHHGDCIGADSEAHGIAYRIGCQIVIHPPSDPSRRAFCGSWPKDPRIDVLLERPYIERNHEIVDICEVLLAAPATDMEKARSQKRSGTWATIRYARSIERPVTVLKR